MKAIDKYKELKKAVVFKEIEFSRAFRPYSVATVSHNGITLSIIFKDDQGVCVIHRGVISTYSELIFASLCNPIIKVGTLENTLKSMA